MSALLKLIHDWESSISGDADAARQQLEPRDFRNLFKDVLHKSPYFLRYSLDSSRPNLFLIHMTDYSDRSNEVVQECNGIILENENYNIIGYGMNRMLDKTEEYAHGKFVPDWEGTFMEEAEDGTVLTVFNHGGTWIVSTKRNIDARNVKWSSTKSFYELLEDAVPGGNVSQTFDKDLDKDYTYSFVLLHPENHLVISHREPKLIFVSRRNMKTLQEDLLSTSDDIPSFSWANKRDALSKETAQQKLSSLTRSNRRGLIFCRKQASSVSVDRYMIDYKWFAEANQLRKGLPTLHLSYLACSPAERQKLRGYFGNLQQFNIIDGLLRDIIRYTYDVYKESYIRKQYKVDYNHPIYKTVRKLHNGYKLTGEPVRIHHVIEVVDGIPLHVLDKMLWYFYSNGFQCPMAVQQEQQPQQEPQKPTPQEEQKHQDAKRIDDEESVSSTQVNVADSDKKE